MLISISDLPCDSVTRHPVSACQPDLDTETIAILRESIRRDGVQSPILITREGAVVDGWHRLNVMLEVAPQPQYYPCLRILTPQECEPERLAQLVDGLLRGRRHLPKRELAAQQVRIYRACGMEWEDSPQERGRSRPETANTLQPNDLGGGMYQNGTSPPQETPEPSPESLPETPKISRRAVAENTGVSPTTARRAIADVKAEEQGPSLAQEKRKATTAAKKRAQLSEAETQQQQLRFWRETAEATGEDLDAARARLDGREIDRQEEIDRLRRELSSARKRADKSDEQARFWETYAKRIETALERLEKQYGD